MVTASCHRRKVRCLLIERLPQEPYRQDHAPRPDMPRATAAIPHGRRAVIAIQNWTCSYRALTTNARSHEPGRPHCRLGALSLLVGKILHRTLPAVRAGRQTLAQSEARLPHDELPELGKRPCNVQTVSLAFGSLHLFIHDIMVQQSPRLHTDSSDRPCCTCDGSKHLGRASENDGRVDKRCRLATHFEELFGYAARTVPDSCRYCVVATWHLPCTLSARIP